MSLWQFFFGAGNQLEFERNKAILAGPAEDVKRIRRLDQEIGKLTRAFNGVARVPPEVTQKIDALVKEVEPSFARVIAKKPYEESQVEALGSFLGGRTNVTEVPVEWLEYVIRYPASYGKPVEQRLAQFKVGK
jgi:hypothetical protein